MEEYGAKVHSETGTGKGVLFILVTSKDYLKGYCDDIVRLWDCFLINLGYQIITKAFSHLEKREFKRELDEMRAYVERKKVFDRFYLIIMSRGNDEGITLYTKDGEPQNIPTEEIVTYFKHDKMPSMKGLPKVFLFQVCKDSKIACANVPGYEETTKKIPIDADIMICYSTAENSLRQLDKNYSHFLFRVNQGISEFKKEDFGIIMRWVKQQINKSIGYTVNEETHPHLKIEPYGDLVLADDEDMVIATGEVYTVDGKPSMTVTPRHRVTVTDNLTKSLVLVDP